MGEGSHTGRGRTCLREVAAPAKGRRAAADWQCLRFAFSVSSREHSDWILGMVGRDKFGLSRRIIRRSERCERRSSNTWTELSVEKKTVLKRRPLALSGEMMEDDRGSKFAFE